MTGVNTLAGLIVREHGRYGIRAMIAGTGVKVRTVVGHYKLGLSAEEIADEMNLELAAIYAALAYYHLNQLEIEAEIALNREDIVKEEIVGGRAN